jgi:L-threonylcarbamoyladenylate synthase
MRPSFGYKSSMTAVQIRDATPASIVEAASLLKGGRLVAFPTETVYGLGARADDDQAVSGIFAVKERPRFNPLIVHVSGRQEAEKLVAFQGKAAALAETFWPGGLTLVLPRKDTSGLSLLVSGGLDSVAVRAPAHQVARALLEEAGLPIAAPSANRSGRISPTTAEAVAEELGGAVAMIVDGGPCPLGVESSVVGFEGEKPVLLRPGAVPREALEAVVGPLGNSSSERIAGPGMMESHYAPRARLRLNAGSAGPDEALLAFGPEMPAGAAHWSNLSVSGDLREAAANFFAMLRLLDRSGAATIAVMPIPEVGLGEAINDRLQRAAAPRPSALL